jgi:hypothetical protein
MATPPFKVKASFDYNSPHEDDLSFPQGQIITVTEIEDDDWYIGEYPDSSGAIKAGLFPQNFVERYEPAPPPRPSRSTKTKVPEPVAEPPAEPPVGKLTEPPSSTRPEGPTAAVDLPTPIAPIAPKPQSELPSSRASEHLPQTTDSPNLKPTSAKPPPPVAEKPASFRDRIAAFNKPAAAPIAPFKPSAAGSGGFIKKPFVAPPPSRNAYVPPPRDPPPQKLYRRDEDPEIAERRAQDQENAERAGLAAAQDQEVDEETPKAVSLKERIALLQKQQMEQAARRSETVAKEKPKRPPKKREISYTGDVAPPAGEAGGHIPEDTGGEEITPHVSHQTAKRPEASISDGNEADMSAAGETTEAEGASGMEEEPSARSGRVSHPADAGDEDVGEAVEESTDDEEMDEETRHQMALRERMAKLSGGMGMPGMFGPPAGLPSKVPGSSGRKKKMQDSREEETATSQATPPAPKVPVFPMPETKRQLSFDIVSRGEPATQSSQSPRSPRPADQPGAPYPKPSCTCCEAMLTCVSVVTIGDPSTGSESDDELPGTAQAPARTVHETNPPPLPTAPPIPKPPQGHPVDISLEDMRESRAAASSPESPVLRSRPPPPIPGIGSPSQSRSEFLPRQMPRSGPEGESEYEGDYDTDIASGVKHKDALKSHVRDSSLDDSILIDEQSPRSPPPIPTSPLANRPVPPLPPSHPPPGRTSLEGHRAIPPPVPRPIPPRELPSSPGEEYDPYHYNAQSIGAAPPQPVRPAGGPPPLPVGSPQVPSFSSVQVPPLPTVGPPPPVPPRNVPMEDSSTEEEEEEVITRHIPQEHPPAPPPPPPATAPSRTSVDHQVQRSARMSSDVDRSHPPKRSMDQHRMAANHEFIASDIALDNSTSWWSELNGLPPAFQGRKDLFSESEENTTSKRGGKAEITKYVYILFQDYSQTVVTARFDPKNPSDVSLEQRHEPPPQRLRQDQLEDTYAQFGSKLAEAVPNILNTTVGDGSPHSLVMELLRPLRGVLLPVGTRAYGAIVYSNLANATVQQFDEIRSGDIVSFRNAKFQGKHGGVMHQKYLLEAGKPDHVGIVVEWDGTKKKIRAIEQGREGKKCKAESFRLGDLRSGEVRVWRVMSRAWVGWDDGSD